MAKVELTEDLIALERAAWAEQQAGALTIPTALAVQTAITAHATAIGQGRYCSASEVTCLSC